MFPFSSRITTVSSFISSGPIPSASYLILASHFLPFPTIKSAAWLAIFFEFSADFFVVS